MPTATKSNDHTLVDDEPEVFDGVIRTADILSGKPCIAGSRISVQLVLEWLAGGGNISDIVRKYPFLTDEDVRQAILFAASHMSASAFNALAGPV